MSVVFSVDEDKWMENISLETKQIRQAGKKPVYPDYLNHFIWVSLPKISLRTERETLKQVQCVRSMGLYLQTLQESAILQ